MHSRASGSGEEREREREREARKKEDRERKEMFREVKDTQEDTHFCTGLKRIE